MEYFGFLLVFAGFLFWFALRDPSKIHNTLIMLGSAVLVGICVWIYFIGRDFNGWAFVFFMFTTIGALIIALLLAIFLKGRRKRFAFLFAVVLPAALYLSMQLGLYTS